MKVIYIAGPFSGANAWEVEKNVREAEVLGMQVAELGAAPLVPHSIGRFYNGTLTYQFWIKATLALMLKSDGVLFTPRWKESAGATAERKEAERFMPVFDTLEDLELWLASPEDGK